MPILCNSMMIKIAGLNGAMPLIDSKIAVEPQPRRKPTASPAAIAMSNFL